MCDSGTPPAKEEEEEELEEDDEEEEEIEGRLFQAFISRYVSTAASTEVIPEERE